MFEPIQLFCLVLTKPPGIAAGGYEFRGALNPSTQKATLNVAWEFELRDTLVVIVSDSDDGGMR